jgi:hypothetical protein
MNKKHTSDHAMGFRKRKKQIYVYEGGYCDNLNLVAYIRKFPHNHTAKNWNQQFVDIANLVEEGTNILSFGKDEEGNTLIATTKQIALYLGVGELTARNCLYELKAAGIIARVSFGKFTYCVMNPEYAVHKDGVHQFVYDMFGVKEDSFEDDVNRLKKKAIKNILLEEKGVK